MDLRLCHFHVIKRLKKCTNKEQIKNKIKDKK